MATPYERLVAEDLNLGHGSVNVTMPAGGQAVGSKIGLDTFMGASMVNIESFGAIHDGAHDDSPAVVAAFAALDAGSTIYFPNGTYRLTATLPALQAMHLVGESRDGTILSWAQTGLDGWGIPSNSSIRQLTLRGPAGASVGHSGIDSGSASYVTLTDVIVENWGDAGINTGGLSSYWCLDRVISRNNKEQGFFLGGGTTRCTFTNCLAIGNIANGFDLNGSQNVLTGCQAVGNGLPGGAVDCFGFLIASAGATYNADDNLLTGCLASGNGSIGFVVRAESLSASRNQFVNCLSELNSGTSSNGDGFNIDGSTAGTMSSNLFANCLARSNQRHGFVVDGSLGTATYNMVVGCIALTNTTNGFVNSAVDSQFRDITAIGNGTALSIAGTRPTVAGYKTTNADGIYRILDALTIGGALTVGGKTIATGGLTVAGDGGLAAGAIRLVGGGTVLRFNSGTGGFQFNDSADGTNLLTLSNTGVVSVSGTINSVGVFKANGTSGVATFGPSAVASITVKNGIVTAIS
jgi:hypothetical protein